MYALGSSADDGTYNVCMLSLLEACPMVTYTPPPVSRLEEKEDTMRKEYAKLHDRYTELFKTHMDYMERTKILLGTDRLDQMNSMLRSKACMGPMAAMVR